MSLFNIMEVAGTGMAAQTVRMNVVSSNLANAGSVASSAEEVFKAKEPLFEAVLKNQISRGGVAKGVRVSGIVEKSQDISSRYQPEHPMANEEGMVFLTNVNPVEEMANMISASRSFQMNVEVANTSKQLLLKTLSMGR